MRYHYSAFADEAASSLAGQLEALENADIPGLDVRNVSGTNVIDLTPHDCDAILEGCAAAKCHVQAIGSPINKVTLDGNTHHEQIHKLELAIKVAHRLNTRRVRLFTPEAPEKDSAAVIRLMKEMIARAAAADVVLLHENDGHYFGAYPENCKRLFGELGGPHFKAAFDFANTTLIGFRPMKDWFPWLLPHLDTLHMKDAIEKENKVVPVGEGDGEIRETLAWLAAQKWEGPFTLEPHLASAGKFSGFSGPELFASAAKAMKEVVEQAFGAKTKR